MPSWAIKLSEDLRAGRGTGSVTQVFVINYRIGRALFLARKRLGVIALPAYVPVLILSRLLSLLVGCSLPFSAQLGRRVRFQHGLHGIFISGLARIADDCIILHQVTVGSNIGSRDDKARAPYIGNRVFIGAGAKIIGNVEVGDGAMIGAQALIIHTVPAGARCYAPIATVISAAGR